MITLISVVLFAFLAVIALALIRLHDLFASVMLLGLFSLLSAGLFTVMDAVDVAFTEAAVGAGISTVLMLGTLALTDSQEKPEHNRRAPIALLAVVCTGSVLVYGTLDMPRYGDPDAAIHKSRLARYYIEKSPDEIGVPNMVTSVLASYRGYDTWGETTVIFTAAVGVMLGLGARRVRRRRTAEEEVQPDDESGGDGDSAP